MGRHRRLLAIGFACPLLTGHHVCGHKLDPPLATPAVVPQDGQTFQRDAATGDVIVSLPFAEPGGAEVRYDAEPWQLLDPDTSDGTASGVLDGVPVGRHTIEVREPGGATLLHATDVGVGDVLVLWGQSNMIMKGETPRSSQGGARTLPIRLAPDAPSLFAPAVDSLWIPSVGPGSAWPLVADAITDATGVPVGFVAVAEGATRLAVDPHWAVGGTLWNRTLQNIRVATADTMRVRAVLAHQGESDAAADASYSIYKAALCAFAGALGAELAPGVPFVVAQIGAFPTVAEARLQAVRDAQRDAALECADIAAGPVTVDLPVDPTGHFGDAAIPELAARWCEALEPLYGAPGALDCR